jgi:hypothetical protein
MGKFEYRQAEEIRDAFARRGVRYLFLGKSGAILLGFPDTTQDVDVFPEKSPANGRALSAALQDLGFSLTEAENEDNSRTDRSTSIWFLRPTELSDSKWHGKGTSISRAFRFATSTTSSPVRKLRVDKRIANRCHA